MKRVYQGIDYNPSSDLNDAIAVNVEPQPQKAIWKTPGAITFRASEGFNYLGSSYGEGDPIPNQTLAPCEFI